ncbi:unnamed protein product [Prunus armeniaca]
MQPANHYFSIEFFQSANHMEQLLFYMLERNYPFFFYSISVGPVWLFTYFIWFQGQTQFWPKKA